MASHGLGEIGGTAILVQRFFMFQIEILKWKGMKCHVILANAFSKLVFHIRMNFSKLTFKGEASRV
jgi:hypothetical protein